MSAFTRWLIATVPLILLCAGFATSGGAAGTLGAGDFAKVTPGKTKDEVRAILGAPARTYPARGPQAESWEYPYRGDWERRTFWVEFAPAGTVSGTNDTKDMNSGAYRGG